jgi:hypothetical protein
MTQAVAFQDCTIISTRSSKLRRCFSRCRIRRAQIRASTNINSTGIQYIRRLQAKLGFSFSRTSLFAYMPGNVSPEIFQRFSGPAAPSLLPFTTLCNESPWSLDIVDCCYRRKARLRTSLRCVKKPVFFLSLEIRAKRKYGKRRTLACPIGGFLPCCLLMALTLVLGLIRTLPTRKNMYGRAHPHPPNPKDMHGRARRIQHTILGRNDLSHHPRSLVPHLFLLGCLAPGRGTGCFCVALHQRAATDRPLGWLLYWFRPRKVGITGVGHRFGAVIDVNNRLEEIFE